MFFLIYGIAWSLSISWGVWHFHLNQSHGKVLARNLARLERKVAQSTPELELAMELFETRKQEAQDLIAAIGPAVSVEFVTQCVTELARQIPKGLWLDSLAFGSLQAADLSDGDESAAINTYFSMTIRGNLFFEANSQESEHLQNFLKRLKNVAPFDAAAARLDLSNMKVQKLQNRYFHNFTIEFIWSDAVL